MTKIFVSADFYKSHVAAYTKKDGTVVRAHDDKRHAAPKKPAKGHSYRLFPTDTSNPSHDPWTDEQWSKLRLDEGNTNAATHHRLLDDMRAKAAAGDIDGLKNMAHGVNTYGKKRAVIAKHLVGAMEAAKPAKILVSKEVNASNLMHNSPVETKPEKKMNGTEKQVAYATKIQAQVANKWNGAADNLEAAAAEGVEPAVQPIVAAIVKYCRDVASNVEKGEDAAYILDHNYSGGQWGHVIYKGGFDKKLTDALGKNDGWNMHQMIASILAEPPQPKQISAPVQKAKPANLDRARKLAGPEFDDMSDDEVSNTLAYSEKGMKREFKPSEASYFRDALRARRKYLEKQAGVVQPKFDEKMYGAASSVGSKDQPMGYMGD